ncbi:hypothetical protein M2158_009750 [Streptomyces sp. SAI-144]|nr:hypothetical protein [Streptomyces sp. SAI-144]
MGPAGAPLGRLAYVLCVRRWGSRLDVGRGSLRPVPHPSRCCRR